ncbi:hypothetical protein ACWEQ7_01545 [Streptomyces sp. NPDC004069]
MRRTVQRAQPVAAPAGSLVGAPASAAPASPVARARPPADGPRTGEGGVVGVVCEPDGGAAPRRADEACTAALAAVHRAWRCGKGDG